MSIALVWVEHEDGHLKDATYPTVSAAAQLGEVHAIVAGSNVAYQSLFFLGLLLFIMTFALNQLGDVFVRRTRQQY